MSNVKLIWATPDADRVVGYCARVSNPANQGNSDVTGLLRYCAAHHHWSIFEMASVCMEIETTRDIGRQILRHRSFSFQEMSQRYQDVSVLPAAPLRECRLQDKTNRQNSIEIAPNEHEGIQHWWANTQTELSAACEVAYRQALHAGIAKEQARALLPEGLTTSRMYMSGTLRSWITYIQVRNTPETQKEHRVIAQQALEILRHCAPTCMNAVFGHGRAREIEGVPV